MKKKFILILKFLISAVLIILLLYKVDLRNFFISLKNTNVLLFCAGLIVSVISIFLRSYKWYLLLIPQGNRFSLFYLTKINFISLFFNNFFLGSIGGDVYKAYVAGKQSGSNVGAASSIIMDRVTGFITLAFIAALSGLIIFISHESPIIEFDEIVVIISAFLVLLVILYAGFKIFFRAGRFNFFVNRFPRISKILEDITISIKVYKNYPRVIIFSFLTSFIYCISTSFAMYFYVLAVGQNVNFILLVFVNLVVSFLVMIPVSVNGIGVQEGAFVFYLTRLGIDPAESLLIALLPRVEIIILSLAGAVIYLYKEKKKSQMQEIINSAESFSSDKNKINVH